MAFMVSKSLTVAWHHHVTKKGYRCTLNRVYYILQWGAGDTAKYILDAVFEMVDENGNVSNIKPQFKGIKYDSFAKAMEELDDVMYKNFDHPSQLEEKADA